MSNPAAFFNFGEFSASILHLFGSGHRGIEGLRQRSAASREARLTQGTSADFKGQPAA
jgi:hypothetical protein